MLKNLITKYWHIALLVFISVAPFFWFLGRPQILIDGADTNFPLNAALWFGRRFFTWQNLGNAGSDFSASTAGTFFHLIQFIPFKLGLSLQTVEITSLIFWFALIIFSSLFLARLILPQKSIPQTIFVILYALNIWMFNSWENVKVANLSLAAAIPLGLSILLLLRDKQSLSEQKQSLPLHGKKIEKGTACLLSIFTGIILSGAGINPAYVICFFLILLIFLVVEILIDFRNMNLVFERIKDFFLISFFIISINLFWILPTIYFILGNITASNSITSLGFTNWVDSLSQNTSLVNVIRMQGAWDWYTVDSATKLPQYIPYAPKYFFNLLFIGFSFLIPSIAFLAFIFKSKKNSFLYIFFSIMLVLGVFLATGTHEPTGTIFKFLAKHIPFFTLFRSPWYIFSPLIGLSIAGLVSLFFYKNKISLLIAPFFIFGCLVYSYPILLGRIFRPNFNGSFYIEFPDYVFQTAKWLDTTASRGRILSYPDDNIERFNWGYSAVDSILGLISDRGVVYSSISDTTSNYSKIVSGIYDSLKRNEVQKASTLINRLGIGQIFEKKDQSSLAPPLPGAVIANKVASFGQWAFYNFPNDKELEPKIYSASCCVVGFPATAVEKNLALVSGNETMVNSGDSLLSDKDLANYSSTIIHAENSQLDDFMAMEGTPLKSRLMVRDLSSVEFDFEVTNSALYQPILERLDVDNFGILNQGKLNANLDGENIILTLEKSDDSFLYFSNIILKEGNHKLIINLKNLNLIDPNNYSKEGPGNFDFSSGQVSITNITDRKVSLNFHVSSFDPTAFYFISVNYKQIYGDKVSLAVDQIGRGPLKTQTENMPSSREWVTYNFYYRPIETKSNLEIDLQAPADGDLGTKVVYQNLQLNQVFSNDLFFKSSGQQALLTPKVTFKENSPVSYSGGVQDSMGRDVIIFNEKYSPNWDFKIFGNDAPRIFHFTANGYANGWYITGLKGDYQFSIYYRPQRYLEIGYILSGVSLLVACCYFIYNLVRKKYGKKF